MNQLGVESQRCCKSRSPPDAGVHDERGWSSCLELQLLKLNVEWGVCSKMLMAWSKRMVVLTARGTSSMQNALSDIQVSRPSLPACSASLSKHMLWPAPAPCSSQLPMQPVDHDIVVSCQELMAEGTAC